MATDEERTVKARIDRIRLLANANDWTMEGLYEAASLAQSVVHDTVGGSHPIMSRIEHAGASINYEQIIGVCQALVELYNQGALKSPRLTIAREIEGDILNLAQTQTQAAELNKDPAQKQVQLGIAAFLAGAAIEDALRRLCDAHGVTYDTQKSSIAKLQVVLYQPSKQIEIISQSENKQITAWGDTRNKGDHGKFAEITHTEVVSMIMGVRTFIEKHLP
jgi:hypothetical protein